MNVAWTPLRRAISLTIHLWVWSASAMRSASWYFKSISCWLGPTSWCMYSTGIFIASSAKTVASRRSSPMSTGTMSK